MPRKRKVAPDATPPPPAAPPWISDLAQQLDAIIEEDPKKRTGGKLMIRALIREALKGKLPAIREILNRAERYRAASSPAAPPRRRGRPATRVDLEEVQRLARKGMRDLSSIARYLGVPKQTLLGPKHREKVMEAYETGRALFESDALDEYADDIAHNRRNPLVIFKLKNLGWSDRLPAALPAPEPNLETALAERSDEELDASVLESVAAVARADPKMRAAFAKSIGAVIPEEDTACAGENRTSASAGEGPPLSSVKDDERTR